MAYTQGYPAASTITTYFASNLIETVTEDNDDFLTEYNQWQWNVLHQTAAARALSVIADTTTTVKVLGGKYYWHDQEKTYTTSAAIDPTDNDTTYVWMEPDNTIDSAIDGTGWPSTEHIKLGAVTTDADGIITDIVDYRRAVSNPTVTIRRLGTAVCDMQNGDGKTTVYTVPTGRAAVITLVVVRGASGDLAGGTDFDFGDGASADTWVNTVDLSGIADGTTCIVLDPDNAEYPIYDAGDAFGIKPVTGATADVTATVDVFGYEIDV